MTDSRIVAGVRISGMSSDLGSLPNGLVVQQDPWGDYTSNQVIWKQVDDNMRSELALPYFRRICTTLELAFMHPINLDYEYFLAVLESDFLAEDDLAHFFDESGKQTSNDDGPALLPVLS